ncbi:unnamed protein product, partial [Notodromas monacha]
MESPRRLTPVHTGSLGLLQPSRCACKTGGQALNDTAGLAFRRIATGTPTAALPAKRWGPPLTRQRMRSRTRSPNSCHAPCRTREMTLDPPGRLRATISGTRTSRGRSASPGATAPADPQAPDHQRHLRDPVLGSFGRLQPIGRRRPKGGDFVGSRPRGNPSVASSLGYTTQQHLHANLEADRAPGLPHCGTPGPCQNDTERLMINPETLQPYCQQDSIQSFIDDGDMELAFKFGLISSSMSGKRGGVSLHSKLEGDQCCWSFITTSLPQCGKLAMQWDFIHAHTTFTPQGGPTKQILASKQGDAAKLIQGTRYLEGQTKLK